VRERRVRPALWAALAVAVAALAASRLGLAPPPRPPALTAPAHPLGAHFGRPEARSRQKTRGPAHRSGLPVLGAVLVRPSAAGRPDPFVPLVQDRSPTPSAGRSQPASASVPLPPLPALPASPGPAEASSALPGVLLRGVVGDPPRLAILQIGDRSYIAGPGETAGPVTVLSVGPDRVSVRAGGVTGIFTLDQEGEQKP
jgi:hypothetical protein